LALASFFAEACAPADALAGELVLFAALRLLVGCGLVALGDSLLRPACAPVCRLGDEARGCAAIGCA
jgi:hypothetical protein